jgi:hypothetical protein
MEHKYNSHCQQWISKISTKNNQQIPSYIFRQISSYIFNVPENDITYYYISNLFKKITNKYTIIIQCIWRKILAKRKLQRLRIKNELEYLPNFGIKYFETKEHWYKNI